MADDRTRAHGPGWDREASLFGSDAADHRSPASDVDTPADAGGGGRTGAPAEREDTLFGPSGNARPSAWSSSQPQEDGPESRHASRRSGSEGSEGSGSFLRELPVLLLIAFVLAFVLRTFVVQVFYIPSSSMEPTLQVDDRMAVEKLTYRFRDPRRGEIVVFEGDSFGEVDPEASVPARVLRGVGQFLGVVPMNARDYVKRVIGLPGDEVRIEEGEVFVNGTSLDEPYVVFGDQSDFGPVTVPEGALFFLGDNRPNSSDSRRSLGFVPIDQVVGRSAAVIWPPGHMGRLTGVDAAELAIVDGAHDPHVSDEAA